VVADTETAAALPLDETALRVVLPEEVASEPVLFLSGIGERAPAVSTPRP
jgi:hypothetical protein